MQGCSAPLPLCSLHFSPTVHQQIQALGASGTDRQVYWVQPLEVRHVQQLGHGGNPTAQQGAQQVGGTGTCPESQVHRGVSVPIQQCRVCAHLQQEAHHALLPGDHCQVQWRLVQVIGEVDNTQVSGMVDDMGYLLDDTGLPMDDG